MNRRADQSDIFDALSCDPMELIARGGDVFEDASRWPQRLREIFDVVLAYLVKEGGPREAAAKRASAVTFLIADYLGGSAVYLPRGDELRRAVYESELYARHNGRNHEQLAREAGITSTALYALLKRERTRRVRKLQGDLFDPAPYADASIDDDVDTE